MPNQLQVEFDGLTGLIPDRPATGDGVPPRFLVALPDVRSGLDVPDPLNHFFPPHMAAVVVPTEAVAFESGKSPELRFQTSKGRFADREYSLYPFNQELLSLSYSGSNALQADLSDLDLDDSPTVPADGQEQALHWIPRVRLFGGTDSAVFRNTEFLNPDFTPVDKSDLKLVGSMIVDRGRLFVDDVIRDEGEVSLFGFRPPGSDVNLHEQAMFSRLLWMDETPDDGLALLFSGPLSDQTGIIGLQALDGAFDIAIVNLELEALLGVSSPTTPDRSADRDFGIFYLFSLQEEPDTDAGFPVPHEPPGVAGGNPRCKFPLFEGMLNPSED